MGEGGIVDQSYAKHRENTRFDTRQKLDSWNMVRGCGKEKERRREEGLPGSCAAPVLEDEDRWEG